MEKAKIVQLAVSVRSFRSRKVNFGHLNALLLQLFMDDGCLTPQLLALSFAHKNQGGATNGREIDDFGFMRNSISRSLKIAGSELP